jgi:hypothetical protein
MEQAQALVENFDSKISGVLNNYVLKPTVAKGVLHLTLMLYAARIAPMPPKPVLDLFDNAYFKLFVMSLILWSAQFSPSTSILIALAFLVTVNYSTSGKLWEQLENVSSTAQLPTASSKDIAVSAATSTVQAQISDAPAVQTMTQDSHTVVITPTITQTASGTVVSNPSVVVAPAIVTKDGKKMVVTPDVSMIPASMPAPLAPVSAPASAPEPAPVSAQSLDSCYPIRQYDLSKITGAAGIDQELASYKSNSA